MEENKTVNTAEKINEQIKNATEAATFIDFKMVTFSLAGKDYAIDIMHVKEIAKAGRFTYVPNTLPFVLGVYNLRGEIIPILDLRLFFNIEVPETNENKLQNLLILTVEDQTFGLVVDKIDKVIGVQKSTIQPPHPLFGDINIKYISGVVESNNRLYVLLDVIKIFASKDTSEKSAEKTVEKDSAPVSSVKAKTEQMVYDSEKQQKVPAASPSAAPEKAAPETKSDVDLKFIADSLKNYKKYYVTSINEDWIRHRYSEWIKVRGEEKSQLQTEADAEEFLRPFWSQNTGDWWTEAYAQNLRKVLPDNAAKQIIVWNPGCGKGIETYCLACVLKERYPNAKIKIYAQDIDLLAVSNAGLMTVPERETTNWFGKYLSAKANNEYTFNQEIKESIMFEYHDCKNTNVLPMVDIIFARDILSLLDGKAQEVILEDFLEKMKGNAVAILGDNERIPSSYAFGEKSVDAIVAYSKD